MDPRLHAIVGATTVIGTELDIVEDAAVVIDGDTIAAVGHVSEIDVPADAEVWDATGATLVPGFIDAHVHIGFYPPAEVLAGGVTTVRDLGWPRDEIFGLARESRRAGFDGPLILAAGPILTAPGGYPTRAAWAPPGTGHEVAGTAGARAAVAEVADVGAAVVKVALNPPAGPTLALQTLVTIVDEAHARGLEVTGHVHDLAELDKALSAGVDELAHMLLSDDDIPEATIERMVDASITVVPTLSVFSGRSLKRAISNLRRFRAAGGHVVYGTDLGNEGPRPGIDPREVAAMAEAGMSGLDVIRAATIDAAAHLGLSQKGAIAPGKDADLVLMDGNPLSDATHLTRVRAVWRRGRTKAS